MRRAHEAPPEELARRIGADHGRRPRVAGIRPEDVVLDDETGGNDAVTIEGTVSKISFAGREAVHFPENVIAVRWLDDRLEPLLARIPEGLFSKLGSRPIVRATIDAPEDIVVVAGGDNPDGGGDV